MDNFFIWIILSRKNTFEVLKFEFQNFQTISDGGTTKMKDVDPKRLYNFLVDNFFYLKSYSQEKLRLNF